MVCVTRATRPAVIGIASTSLRSGRCQAVLEHLLLHLEPVAEQDQDQRDHRQRPGRSPRWDRGRAPRGRPRRAGSRPPRRRPSARGSCAGRDPRRARRASAAGRRRRAAPPGTRHRRRAAARRELLQTAPRSAACTSGYRDGPCSGVHGLSPCACSPLARCGWRRTAAGRLGSRGIAAARSTLSSGWEVRGRARRAGPAAARPARGDRARGRAAPSARPPRRGRAAQAPGEWRAARVPSVFDTRALAGLYPGEVRRYRLRFDGPADAARLPLADPLRERAAQRRACCLNGRRHRPQRRSLHAVHRRGPRAAAGRHERAHRGGGRAQGPATCPRAGGTGTASSARST